MKISFPFQIVVLAASLTAAPLRSSLAADTPAPPAGSVPLFNGKDLTGWKVPEGDGGHWKVVDGVIDYDAGSEAPGDKNLWTEKEYGDFVLRVDWRIKETPYVNPNVPYILPDGSHARDVRGREMRMALPDSDAGVIVRGDVKYQVNIWCWPIGSGATIPGLPAKGRIGLQHHGGKRDGKWNSPPSLLQFRNLHVKELGPGR